MQFGMDEPVAVALWVAHTHLVDQVDTVKGKVGSKKVTKKKLAKAA